MLAPLVLKHDFRHCFGQIEKFYISGDVVGIAPFHWFASTTIEKILKRYQKTKIMKLLFLIAY